LQIGTECEWVEEVVVVWLQLRVKLLEEEIDPCVSITLFGSCPWVRLEDV
jgi:hypothetical protein